MDPLRHAGGEETWECIRIPGRHRELVELLESIHQGRQVATALVRANLADRDTNGFDERMTTRRSRSLHS
jgi:hypothetical protein